MTYKEQKQQDLEEVVAMLVKESKAVEKSINVTQDPLFFQTFKEELYRQVNWHPEEVHNTVYEYTNRRAALVHYAVISVKCKYKNRNKVVDYDWVTFFAHLYNTWVENSLIKPALLNGGVIKLVSNALIDEEKRLYINLGEDGKYSVVPMDFNPFNIKIDNNNGAYDHHIKLPEYTDEELGELTYTTFYAMYPVLNQEEFAKYEYLNRFDRWLGLLNEIVGRPYFVNEGELPSVVFDLEKQTVEQILESVKYVSGRNRPGYTTPHFSNCPFIIEASRTVDEAIKSLIKQRKENGSKDQPHT